MQQLGVGARGLGLGLGTPGDAGLSQGKSTDRLAGLGRQVYTTLPRERAGGRQSEGAEMLKEKLQDAQAVAGREQQAALEREQELAIARVEQRALQAIAKQRQHMQAEEDLAHERKVEVLKEKRLAAKKAAGLRPEQRMHTSARGPTDAGITLASSCACACSLCASTQLLPRRRFAGVGTVPRRCGDIPRRIPQVSGAEGGRAPPGHRTYPGAPEAPPAAGAGQARTRACEDLFRRATFLRETRPYQAAACSMLRRPPVHNPCPATSGCPARFVRAPPAPTQRDSGGRPPQTPFRSPLYHRDASAQVASAKRQTYDAGISSRSTTAPSPFHTRRSARLELRLVPGPGQGWTRGRVSESRLYSRRL